MHRRTFIGTFFAGCSMVLAMPSLAFANVVNHNKRVLWPAQQRVQHALTTMDAYGFTLSQKAAALGYRHQAIRYHDELLGEALSSAYEFSRGDIAGRAETFNGIHEEISSHYGTEVTDIHRLILSGEPQGFGGRTIRELITGTTSDMVFAHRYLISCFHQQKGLLPKTPTTHA